MAQSFLDAEIGEIVVAYDSQVFKERWKNDPIFRENKLRSYKKWFDKQTEEKKRELRNSKKPSYARWCARPENKIKLAQWQRDYKNRHRMRYLARLAIRRAKVGEFPCDEEYLFSLEGVRPATCDCCGSKFEYSNKERRRFPYSDGPTLDKIIQERGYVRGNVGIVCWRCNSLKKDATLKELRMLVAYIERFQNG